jgi:hypothetical protein
MESRVMQKYDMHSRKRIKERDQLEHGSAPNAEYLRLLEAKESMLGIQAIILGNLAREENSLKGFSNNPGVTIADFQCKVNEAEEALRLLSL